MNQFKDTADKELYQKVIESLSSHLDKEIEISLDNHLKEDLGLPSMKLVFFFTDITAKLGINIMDFADYELLNLNTVEDIFNLLKSKQ